MARKHIIVGLAVALLAGGLTSQPPLSVLKEMKLVISQDNAKKCGHDYSNAAAWIYVSERGQGTGVSFVIRGAKPNALYTVWLRLGELSPITGAPATPAVPIRGIDNVIRHSGTTSAAGATAFFYTNKFGCARLWIPLDFRLSDGVYPFSRYNSALKDVAIGHSPFTFRVVSHCTNGLQQGLVPSVNEPTFDVSLQ